MASRAPHLSPQARDVWTLIHGGVAEVDALFADLATEVEGIVRSYPNRALTEAERLSMMRRIDRAIEYRFGVTRGMAIESPLYGTISRATDMAAEAPFRRLLGELERGVAQRDPSLWNRIQASLMNGGTGTGDHFARVYAELNGPKAQRQRFLRSGLMDKQRRWVNADGYRLSDRVWMRGRDVRRAIDREILSAIRSGDGPETLARRLTDYLHPQYAPTRYLKDGRVIRRPGARPYGAAASRRLARTEIQRIHHAATVELGKSDVPGMRGIKWNLSPRHPKVDVCDDLARDDDGLGRGVYLPDYVPDIPHPQCICYLTPAMASRSEVIDELVERYG